MGQDRVELGLGVLEEVYRLRHRHLWEEGNRVLRAGKDRNPQEAPRLGFLHPNSQSQLSRVSAECPRVCFHDISLKTKTKDVAEPWGGQRAVYLAGAGRSTS